MLSINVQQLHKTFPNGTRALQGVDLHVAAGESVVLLGHNGSGKSTLLRCLNGLEEPTRGMVHIGETQLTGAPRRVKRQLRQDVGVVFQRFNLVPNLSAFQNVLFGGMGRVPTLLHSFSLTAPVAERERAMECLERVGLAHLAAQRADTLSGGQQQRVAIARTLMQDPRVILADEPIASLDPKAGHQVMELLHTVAAERGLTVVCTLHHLDVARTYGQRFVALHGGRKVIDAPAAQVSDKELEALYGELPMVGEDFADQHSSTDYEAALGMQS